MKKEEKVKLEEDYLKDYLNDTDTNKMSSGFSKPKLTDEHTSPSRTVDLQYFSFDIKNCPLGQFYPNGTILMVRAAQVREIQAYSMLDDTNYYDMIEKMNDMLSACVRVKYIDGTFGSYLDIKDGDRYFLIFLIRELTFQQGQNLVVNSTCLCGEEVQIELKRDNFEFHVMDESLLKYFDINNKLFKFKVKNGEEFNITLPSIGIQKSFTDYIVKEFNDKKTPNMSFLKIIPFTLGNINGITYEGIKKKLVEFQNMNDVSFQFLNGAVNKMKFGIKELKKSCSGCGQGVHTEFVFPNGASTIFVIHDAFEQFIGE